MKQRIFSLVVSFIFLLSFINLSFADNKISILVSGQSHASLYPCSCPKSPSGGLSRRATAIKNIKSKGEDVILLEAGGSFAGGNYDTNSQTTELDKERTQFYMKSLLVMGYDAFLVSSEEFNFGDDFLNEVMADYPLNYLSANIKGVFQPYIIREVRGIDIAIIGVSDAAVKNKTKASYIKIEESLSKTIKEIKTDKKASLIIALTYLDEEGAGRLLERIDGLDILIASHNPFKQTTIRQVNKTIVVEPGWQARSLVKIDLTFSDIEQGAPLKLTLDAQDKGSKNSAFIEAEDINLTGDIKDSPEITAIIPACFKDSDCIKPGYSSKCEDAATGKSQCSFSEIKTVKLTVIKPLVCKTCNIDEAIERIKAILPHLDVKYISEDSPQAKKIIEQLNIKMLPAYLINEPTEEIASRLSQVASKKGKFYVLEPGFTGVSYFVNRKKIPNRLDVFFDIHTPEILKILDTLQVLKNKNPNVDIHLNFLAIEDPKEGIISKNGKYELEEFLRSACINKYYPDMLWYYLSCRISAIDSSWWDDCVAKFNMDSGKIKGCAQTQEGKMLLRDLIKLTQELEIVFGPTFLINNQEILSSQGAPSEEELEKLFE